MFERIYLHIGSGKTGTSSIQGTLWRNAGRLAGAGVFHVRKPMGLLSKVIDDPNRLVPIRAANMDPKAVLALQDECEANLREAAERSDLHTAIFSTEHSLILRENEVAHLRAILLEYGRDLRVIYYVRHPYSKVASAYAQRVKGGQCALDTDLTRFMEPPSIQLANWIAVFGKDAIDVRKFELSDMRDNSPVADFFEAIGQPDLYPQLDIKVSNEGISHAAVLIADKLYQHFPLFSEGRGPRDYLNAIGGRKFTIHPDRIRELEPRIEAELAWLEREFGVVLKTPALKDHTDDRNVIFSDEVIESIALAFNSLAVELQEKEAKLKFLRRRNGTLRDRLAELEDKTASEGRND